MDVLKRISQAASSQELAQLIQRHKTELFDYFALVNFKELQENRETFKALALQKNQISGLDFGNPENVVFINLMLQACIRHGNRFIFDMLYGLLIKHTLPLSPAIEAAALYMHGVREVKDYHQGFAKVISILENAYLEEIIREDDANAVLIHLYLECIKNFPYSPDASNYIHTKLHATRADEGTTFLNNVVVDTILAIELAPSAYDAILHILDDYLGRNKTLRDWEKGHQVEQESDYATAYKKIESEFDLFYKLNNDFYLPIRDDAIYRSLKHGVQILETPEQLLVYIVAYSQMHWAKVSSAINALPSLEEPFGIVDWGCGQGIASLCYCYHLKNEKLLKHCQSIILIEPSLIALKRAALHLSPLVDNMFTVNKDFDSLDEKDFELSYVSPNFHFFSNVLDMDSYSLKKLTFNIETNFKGVQYFVVCSPYVNTITTSRIDAFMDHFQKFTSFEISLNENNLKGQWQHTSWSRVVRVFKVEL